MNLPNKLTIGRIITAIIILIMLIIPWDNLGIVFPTFQVAGRIPVNLKYIIAGILFVVAALTDFLDGHIARSRNLVTDFGKVMKLLQCLNKYPEYLIVLSDMEFDSGSNQSKEETMKLFKQYGAETKIIWWNLNDRNKTVPEFDEYGNIYLSGYNLQILKLLENGFDMTTYIDKLLEEYKKNIDYKA